MMKLYSPHKTQTDKCLINHDFNVDLNLLIYFYFVTHFIKISIRGFRQGFYTGVLYRGSRQGFYTRFFSRFLEKSFRQGFRQGF